MTPNFSFNSHAPLIIFLAALPGSGKTSLAKALVQIFGENQTALYLWGKQVAIPVITQRYGSCTIKEVEQYFREVELGNPVAMAEEFLARTDVRTRQTRFIIIDGIKNRRQLEYIAEKLNLPWVLITIFREDEIRLVDTKKRGENDDNDDARRLKYLNQMDLPQLIEGADFTINNTGFTSDSQQDKWFDLHYPVVYLQTMHEMFIWFGISTSLEMTLQIILSANDRALKKIGFQTITCEVKTE